jgi:hypothetical protein
MLLPLFNSLSHPHYHPTPPPGQGGRGGTFFSVGGVGRGQPKEKRLADCLRLTSLKQLLNPDRLPLKRFHVRTRARLLTAQLPLRMTYVRGRTSLFFFAHLFFPSLSRAFVALTI